MTNAFLIGPRLYLRPLEREDAPVLTGYLNHPSVRRTLARYRPLTVAQEVARLEALANSDTDVLLGVVLRDGEVWLQVYGHHAAAQRAYEKVGFRREGVQREQYFVEGRYVDGILMGILRSEWTPLLPELQEALKEPGGSRRS